LVQSRPHGRYTAYVTAGSRGVCGIPEEGGVKRKLIAAIGIAGMMFSIAACGDSDKSGGSDKGADAKELTVWLTVDAQNNLYGADFLMNVRKFVKK